MLTRQPLFAADFAGRMNGDQLRQLKNWSDSHRRERLQVIPDPKARDIVEKLLQKNPSDRISAKDLVKHPFFNCDNESVGDRIGPDWAVLDEDTNAKSRIRNAAVQENYSQECVDSLFKENMLLKEGLLRLQSMITVANEKDLDSSIASIATPRLKAVLHKTSERQQSAGLPETLMALVSPMISPRRRSIVVPEEQMKPDQMPVAIRYTGAPINDVISVLGALTSELNKLQAKM